MSNQHYTGIAFILIYLLFAFVCFRFYKKANWSFCLVSIIVLGISLRVVVAFDPFLHFWDERYHALVAKNLLDYPFKPMLYSIPLLEYDYKNWAGNHIWLHKQPVPLWAMALSLWTFGKSAFAVRIPSIILSSLGIVFTYKIGKHLFSQKVAIIAAFLFSINGLILELSGGRQATDHIDIFFLGFITIAVYCALKFAATNKGIFNFLCGVFLGLAILSKWLPALIVLPISILALLQSGKLTMKEIARPFLILLLTVVVTTLPWQLYIHNSFPLEAAREGNYNLLHFTSVLKPHGHPIYYHFDRMRIIFGELIYLPVIWLIWITVKKKNNYKYWILLIWIIIPFVFF